MDTSTLRQQFLDFFAGATACPSSPLVPGNDPTAFTNAGMVQFKTCSSAAIGAQPRRHRQRAGGKHNDLENVGYTARHHTFFEMLGNFSWRLLQARRHPLRLGVHHRHAWRRGRLWVTVYRDDDEAADIWLKVASIRNAGRLGGRQLLGDGRHRSLRPVLADLLRPRPRHPGGPPGSPDEDGDRYVEIWNLVFMQFDRAADGT